MFDLIIRGGTVVTMNRSRDVLMRGAVAIKGGRIAAVGDDGQFETATARQIIDASDMCVIPGLIDSHGHAGHSLTKTLGEAHEDGWLNIVENIYLRGSTEQFWYIEAQLAALERLKFGVTCGYSMLGNMPRADDPVYSVRHMEGASSVGIRDILGIGPANPPWPKSYACWQGGKPRYYNLGVEHAMRTTEQVLSTWSRSAPKRALVHVSPSRVGDISGMDSEKVRWQTDEVKRLASEYGVMINAHAYKGDIKYAHEHLDVLGPRVVLAHCTGITEDEVKILADTGTNVSSSPSARAFTQDRCPVPELITAGANVAISTDGTGPDRTFDLFKDMRVMMLLQRAHFRDPRYMPPGKVFEMVTIDAAKALGMDSQIGSLEVGKAADVVLVKTLEPHLYPWCMPVERLAYEVSGQDVDTVIVDGEVLMQRRKVLSIDEDAVLRSAQREFVEMLNRTGNHRYLESPERFWRSSRY